MYISNDIYGMHYVPLYELRNMENYLDWKYTFFEQDGLSVYIAYIPNKLKEITNRASNLKRTFSNPIVDILLFYSLEGSLIVSQE